MPGHIWPTQAVLDNTDILSCGISLSTGDGPTADLGWGCTLQGHYYLNYNSKHTDRMPMLNYIESSYYIINDTLPLVRVSRMKLGP